MPEIAEVARVVHYIRTHLANHTILKASATEDANVFGKVGTSASAVQSALTGRKILDGKQQGKYFWLELDRPPHLLMHFGMTGWFHIKGMNTGYREAGRDIEVSDEEWPPKYTKFHIELDDGTQAAFADSRRFARVRLVDAAAEDMRTTTPLKENGPDPVVDKKLVTEAWLAELCARKKAPIKAVLLDQANISGIGNWVSDEIFYDAKMHPEQYSNTLSKEQIRQLHKSIHYVCGTACELLADSSRFPETWLFKWRWGKGKKDAPKKLPNGEKIEFLTVGGRTSAVIPSVQKKTGPVTADVDGAGQDEKPKSKAGKGGKRKLKEESEEDAEEEEPEEKAPATSKLAKGKKGKSGDAVNATVKKPAATTKSKKAKIEEPTPAEDTSGRRRSKRVSTAGK